jgi:hypothetical protein
VFVSPSPIVRVLNVSFMPFLCCTDLPFQFSSILLPIKKLKDTDARTASYFILLLLLINTRIC